MTRETSNRPEGQSNVDCDNHPVYSDYVMDAAAKASGFALNTCPMNSNHRGGLERGPGGTWTSFSVRGLG